MKFYISRLLKFVWLSIILLLIGCSIRVVDTPTTMLMVTKTPIHDASVTDLAPLPFTGKIAFVHPNGKDKDIYVMNADGSNLQFLAKGQTFYSQRLINWSPDGKYIAFTSMIDSTEQIYKIKSDGSDLQQLTSVTSPSYDPIWSPDGKYIAFTSMIDSTEQIYKIKSDGSDLQQLTSATSPSYDPVWSPDGKYIAFMSEQYDVLDKSGYPIQNAYIMKSDGSEQYPLTNGFVNSVSWYPRTNFLSVSVPESRYTLKTYILNVNGVIQNQFHEFVTSGAPHWSPSGQFVLFENIHALETSHCSDISVMKPDSLNTCFVIDAMIPPVRTITPSWSPDDKYVIFSSNLDGNYNLYVVRPDGSNLTQLTNMTGDELFPIWSLAP